MTSNEAVATVVDVLNRAGIPYMLAGSYSSNYYGVPRSTRDADFVIQTTPDVLIPLFSSLRDKIRLDPQSSFEDVTSTHRHIASVADGPFKIEFFYLSDDPFDRVRFSRRQKVQAFDRTLYLPTPEDVIVMKLRWSVIAKRSRDLCDVRDVIAVQRDAIDWSYVEHWCAQHGSLPLLRELLSNPA